MLSESESESESPSSVNGLTGECSSFCGWDAKSLVAMAGTRDPTLKESLDIGLEVFQELWCTVFLLVVDGVW
jgi:hypothetical protein